MPYRALPRQTLCRGPCASPLTRCNSLQSMLQIQNLKAGFPCLQGRTAQVERSFRPTLRGSLHPLSIVAFFSLIFRSAPPQNKAKSSVAPKPETAKNPKRWTSTTSAHNRPEPRPETKPNRPTDPDRPNPVQDPGREPTPNCTTKFSRVRRPLFSRNSAPPSSGL